MHGNARLPGHLSLGLFATSLIFDLIRLFSTNGVWSVVSEYLIGAGVIGGLLAAFFGSVDRIANVVVTGMFMASWLLRLATPADPPAGALILSAFAVVVALGTERLRAAAQRANLNGSLSGHPTFSR